jgi:hypothetical protein
MGRPAEIEPADSRSPDPVTPGVGYPGANEPLDGLTFVGQTTYLAWLGRPP